MPMYNKQILEVEANKFGFLLSVDMFRGKQRKSFTENLTMFRD